MENIDDGFLVDPYRVIYKVYALPDENNCIISIWSTGNQALGDTRTEQEMIELGYILIDEGTDGSIYGYAQTNYFEKKHGKPMYDERMIPNFKYVDSQVKELEENDKQEWFIKPMEIEAEKEKQQNMLEDMMRQAQQVSFLVELPDAEAAKIPYCFDSYDDDPDGFPYEKNMRREYKGQLYKCLQGYKKEKDNPTQNPDVAVSLWVLTSSEEWPEWVQPTGSHDAYDTGDKVTHNGHKYTSKIDGNTTEPGTDDRWWTLVE